MAQKSLTPVKQNPAAAKNVNLPHSFFRNDFPIIRKASITFGVCVLSATLLIGGSQFLLSKQEASNLQAQSELSQAKGKYTAAANEKDEIRNFQPKYIQLTRRGFVGEEKRLDVIEAVHSIQENRQLLPITYEIFPQQIFQIDPSIQTGELELRGSKLVVRMGLLHEMDILTLLTDLSGKGMFSPQACFIKPNEGAKIASLSAQLQAECTLYWITMGRRAPADGAPPVAAQ
jgi:hypothetical protein